MKNPYEMSAVEAIDSIRSGKMKVIDLVESCIERIRILEPKIHTWSFFDPEIPRRQARFVDEQLANGTFRGTLCGIPVGIKDIYNTCEMPTEMGSPIWKGFNPGNDARAIYYLKDEGAIAMGKTVTAEFAVHHPGPTVNPHDASRTPGTSSSGSAAAVACCMVPLSIGSQTAGSTIRPASYCGVYGFKPTFGLIPRTGVLKTVDVLDHVTLFARTIEDIKLAFDAMRVRGNNFPYVRDKLDAEKEQKEKGPWKVAFIKTHLWDHWEDYAKKEIVHFIDRLSAFDTFQVKEVRIPDPLTRAHDVHDVIYTKALSYYYAEEYQNHRDTLSDVFRNMIERGNKMTKDQYVAALAEQEHFSHILDSFFNSYDAIITLSTAGEAKVGLDSVDTVDSCLIWTLCGAPSINVPVFRGPNDMPFGAQVIFRKYKDHSMFHFLRSLEQHGLAGGVTSLERVKL